MVTETTARVTVDSILRKLIARLGAVGINVDVDDDVMDELRDSLTYEVLRVANGR